MTESESTFIYMPDFNMSSTDRAPTVAVIGLGKSRLYNLSVTRQETEAYMIPGPLGIVSVKNMVEEGFDVTGFERNNHSGGLWRYSPEDKTSVLPSKKPIRLFSPLS